MYTVENKLIVKRLEQAAPSSVYIPDAAKEQPIEGIVIETGPDAVCVQKGSHIMFNPNRAVTFKVMGEEFIVIKLEDVFIVMGEPNGDK